MVALTTAARRERLARPMPAPKRARMWARVGGRWEWGRGGSRWAESEEGEGEGEGEGFGGGEGEVVRGLAEMGTGGVGECGGEGWGVGC
jgi:hypothetical protein